jgi:hypothetical protein
MYFGSMPVEYYYSWYCAKRLYKNVKWQGNVNKGGTDKSFRDYKTTIISNPRGFRCITTCPSFTLMNGKPVCTEKKSVRADWVEKNL